MAGAVCWITAVLFHNDLFAANDVEALGRLLHAAAAEVVHGIIALDRGVYAADACGHYTEGISFRRAGGIGCEVGRVGRNDGSRMATHNSFVGCCRFLNGIVYLSGSCGEVAERALQEAGGRSGSRGGREEVGFRFGFDDNGRLGGNDAVFNRVENQFGGAAADGNVCLHAFGNGGGVVQEE